MMGRPEFSQISIVGLIRRCMKPGSLQARNGQWVYCTDKANTILGSPTRSFLFIRTLPWCKHGTMAIGSPELPKFQLSALYGAA